MSQPSKQVKARYREKHREILRRRGREYYHYNARAQKDRTLRRRYGITILDYENKVVAQNNKCAVCGLEERAIGNTSGKRLPLAVDHNHETNQVRDLLCYRCNAVIGFMERNPELYIKMLDYLLKHNGKPLIEGLQWNTGLSLTTTLDTKI